MQPQLIRGRDFLTPYLYPQAMEFYKQQTNGRWEADDISFGKDVTQWLSIDPAVKEVVAGVLRGFVQVEAIVGEYWGTNIPKWFPHPEIAIMARRMSDTEGVHALSYNQLSVSLGLDTYEAFKADTQACNKIAYLMSVTDNNLSEIARSLAVFSAFTEGVTLFSSFAILQWLKGQGLLPGVTAVIEYSVRDEGLHSTTGCWLFRQLIEEAPELDTPELWDDIYAAAQATIQLEHSFIDSVFKDHKLEGLDPKDLKQFIQFRTDAKLQEIGSPHRFEYDAEASDRIAVWFDLLNIISPITDGFVRRPTTYTKGVFKPKAKFAFA